jgi:sulfopyruvate decarboxylase TPP-binding subunit
MICAVNFLKILRGKGIEFYAGVPDSILKDFCSAIQNSNENINHITASNEGTALGMAIGHHLATGKVPVVYLQNSGIGNLKIHYVHSLLQKYMVFRFYLLLDGAVKSTQTECSKMMSLNI